VKVDAVYLEVRNFLKLWATPAREKQLSWKHKKRGESLWEIWYFPQFYVGSRRPLLLFHWGHLVRSTFSPMRSNVLEVLLESLPLPTWGRSVPEWALSLSRISKSLAFLSHWGATGFIRWFDRKI